MVDKEENKNATSGSQDEVSESIITIASEMFARYGFKKTTMDDIARAMRKGKSSIYYYFKSKEEIFEAVINCEANKLRIHIYEAMDAAPNIIEKIRSYTKIRMLAVQQLINYYSVIKDNYFDNLELAENVRKRYDTEELEIINNLLAEGVQDGTFHIKNVQLSSMAFLTAMRGLEVPFMVDDTKTDNLQSIIDDLLDILFYGIVKMK